MGEAIGFNVRLLAVANTFCALMRLRSYRMVHSVEDSLAILAIVPAKYDAQVLQALRALLESAEGRTFFRDLCPQVSQDHEVYRIMKRATALRSAAVR